VDVVANPNCKLFVNSPSELYEIDSSYGYNKENNAMHVALHIPLVGEGQELGVKEFIPHPLK
jgi:hypothetical protein